MSSSSSLLLFSCLLFFFFTVLVEAKVPLAKAFKKSVINQGSLLSGKNVEYNANYRLLGISNHPFHLCFYNTTPNAYFLGLGMGKPTKTSLMRWVWTANPARPVSENAKLIFARNGNLVLVDGNGRVAWQTHTADRGVEDIKLLPNGNLVLLNKAGGFVWQSFGHPTDTLLVGQSLFPGQSLINKAYSLVVTNELVYLSFKNPVSSKILNYYTISTSLGDSPDGYLQSLIFMVAPETDGSDHANELRLVAIDFFIDPNVLAQPKYNSTLSMLRLGSNGNMHVYTYYENKSTGIADAWEETYTFTKARGVAGECYLPEKCGEFGLCENSKCVACPTGKGLQRWSNEDCKPIKKMPSCKANATNAIKYYKLNGVGHDSRDLNNYVLGQSGTTEECRKECSKDCKCLGFSVVAGENFLLKCWLVYEIKYTLIKDYGLPYFSTYSTYIKYTK